MNFMQVDAAPLRQKLQEQEAKLQYERDAHGKLQQELDTVHARLNESGLQLAQVFTERQLLEVQYAADEKQRQFTMEEDCKRRAKAERDLQVELDQATRLMEANVVGLQKSLIELQEGCGREAESRDAAAAISRQSIVLRDQLRAMQQQVEALEGQLNDKDVQIASFEENLEELRVDLKREKQELVQLQQTDRELRQQLGAMQQQAEGMEGQLKDKDAQIVSFAEKLEEVREGKIKLGREKEEAEARCAAAEAELEAMRDTVNTSVELSASLERDLVDTRAEVDSKKHRLSEKLFMVVSKLSADKVHRDSLQLSQQQQKHEVLLKEEELRQSENKLEAALNKLLEVERARVACEREWDAQVAYLQQQVSDAVSLHARELMLKEAALQQLLQESEWAGQRTVLEKEREMEAKHFAEMEDILMALEGTMVSEASDSARVLGLPSCEKTTPQSCALAKPMAASTGTPLKEQVVARIMRLLHSEGRRGELMRVDLKREKQELAQLQQTDRELRQQLGAMQQQAEGMEGQLKDKDAQIVSFAEKLEEVREGKIKLGREKEEAEARCAAAEAELEAMRDTVNTSVELSASLERDLVDTRAEVDSEKHRLMDRLSRFAPTSIQSWYAFALSRRRNSSCPSIS